jgi:hypothetical protein
VAGGRQTLVGRWRSSLAGFLVTTYGRIEVIPEDIARILLVAVLSEATTAGVDSLSKDERHFLYLLSRQHLSDLGRADLKDAIAAVTHISDKAKEVWNSLIGPVSAGLNIALAHWGFKAPEISKFENDKGTAGPLRSR